ncbi:hypothetical protein J5L43_004384 [Salmonella enterica subsp. enterica serovar Enteritidis]|nr:hypothetical protein [Salmonella enterica subsp. enterica serovar Enteritidis]
MLGGADNPNGELLSYIIGADSCPGADAKVFDASGKKFCGWYISPLDD